MKITKTKLLLLAVMCVLVLPLAIGAGNAWAVTGVIATTGTYNTDASVQNTSGGWNLPSNFYCIATPSGWTPSGTGDLLAGGANDAVHRTDLDCADATSPVCGTCTISGDAANAVKYTDWPTDTAKRGIDDCVSHGYAWSGYSQSCGAANWTTDDPDNSPLPYYTDHKGCLRCHNDAYINAPGGHHYGDDWAVKESYLMTGHKNMVRMVTPSQGPFGGNTYVMLGPDGNQYANLNADGTDASTDARVYWIAAGWYSNGEPHLIESGSSYSCGRCHATGWTADASTNTDKEPYVSFGDLTGIINLQDTHISPATNTSSWDRWGIECSRCHQATGGPTGSEPGTYSGGHTTFPESSSTGGDVTAMCANCHRQESNDVPLGYEGTDYTSTYPAADVFQPAGIRVHYKSSGSSDSHGPVYQFLNSPHARFSGTSFGDIGCPPTSIVPDAGYTCDSSMSTYDSDFTVDPKSNEGQLGKALGGGCTGCHDVHYSVDEVTGQADKATKSCEYCHSDSSDTYAPQVDLAVISHSNLPGTPLDTTMYMSACEVCHMPGGDHYFRVNTDPNYSTKPSGAGYANVAPDDGYNNAIWNDLNSTCGQCHGGDSATTKNGAPHYDKLKLAAYALGIHNNDPLNGNFSLSYGSDNATASVSAFASGVTCDYNWGDGSSHGTNCTDTHTYATGGEKLITLTVTSGADEGARAHVFTAVVPTPPTASADETWNSGTWTEQLVDTSTAVAPNTISSVTVAWGDGITSSGHSGDTFTHTYSKVAPFGAYTVTLTAKDNTGQTGTANFFPAPANPVITGNVYKHDGTTGISGAYVLVTRTYNSRTYTYYAVTNSLGHYQFSTLYPGVYSNLRVMKSGYSFTPIASPATDGTPNNFTAN
jgi:hypothetical protein